MIRLVASDLDGTLLRSDLTLSDRTRTAVAEVLSRGVRFVIATGRMFTAARPYALSLAYDIPIVAYNGALVRMGGSGTVLTRTMAPAGAAEAAIRFMYKHHITVQAYDTDDVVWAPRMSADTEAYCERYGAEVRIQADIDEFVKMESMKYLVIDEPERIPAIRGVIQDMIGPELRLMASQPHLLEIVDSCVSKAAALRYLAQLEGIDMSEVMAIGDSENDVEMIREAGLGIAVSNAQPMVAAAADAVGSSNDEDGAAEALERFVLV